MEATLAKLCVSIYNKIVTIQSQADLHKIGMNYPIHSLIFYKMRGKIYDKSSNF